MKKHRLGSVDNMRMMKRLPLIISIFLIILLMMSCSPNSATIQKYENEEFGISLELPTPWRLNYFKRGGKIIIYISQNNETSIVRIQVQGLACLDLPDWAYDQLRNIEDQIDSIKAYYEVDSIIVLQDTKITEINEKTIYQKIIRIPTMALPADAIINQWGEQSPLIDQEAEIYAITKGDAFVLVQFYLGPYDNLNEEGRDIIDSIQFLCSDGK